jgi:catechol 2,3-dioxygenase-like lactoylglutathione lyase family enzyme
MAIKFSLVGIATKDMAASLRFYRLLGVEVPEERETESHVEVAFGDVRLGWDTVDVLEGVYGGWEAHPVGLRIELAFDCETRDGVDAVYARLTGAGHRGHREPWDAVWGQRYAIVEDPDGNLVSLFAA